ncbi:hypothetical protein [Ferrimicrobium sp.]|uniref:Y-family DNA polymerase n=1 Tax=Ferrimicrobium sp. TaxID=2926050 RepID=UPI00260C5759|nr:hypothetical protein [Ferrimicrobium sp.]
MMLTTPRRVVALDLTGISALALDLTVSDCAAVVYRGQIVEVAEAAKHHGVVVGMRSSEAMARCPMLEVRERDQYREEQWLARLLRMFDAVSPHFRRYRHSFIAPLGSMTRYFGSEPQVFAAIESVIASLTQTYPQVRATLGAADSVFVALVAARLGCRIRPGESVSFVGERRVTELLPTPVAAVLREVGMERIADFQRLDGAVVAARFGGTGLRWHRLCRLEADLVVGDDDLSEIVMCTTTVFDGDTTERISFRLMRPLDRLVHAAEQSGLVLVKANMVLVTTTGELTKVVEVLDGASTTELIARLRWFEQATRSRRDPLVEVRVEPLGWSPLRRRQLTLDRQELKESAILATLTRLTTLYGDASVRVPVLQGGRSLGEQGVWVPWNGRWPSPMPSDDTGAPWPGRLRGAAPSLVYQHPREVGLFDVAGVPVGVYGDGVILPQPAVLVRGREQLVISAFHGPWVVVERWWEHRRRRYVRLMVITPKGVSLVIREAQRWWLEGEFA